MDHRLAAVGGLEGECQAVREWPARLKVQTLYIERGSPWENGYVESFNGNLRNELLDREIFYTLQEAQVLVERWRQHYNRFRPHSSLGDRPPAPDAIEIKAPGMVPLTLAVARSNIESGLPQGAGHSELGVLVPRIVDPIQRLLRRDTNRTETKRADRRLR